MKRRLTIAEHVVKVFYTTRDNVTQENIKKWFSEVESGLKGGDLIEIMKHPDTVFNTYGNFLKSKTRTYVFARKSHENVYASSGDDKENVTVLVK